MALENGILVVSVAGRPDDGKVEAGPITALQPEVQIPADPYQQENRC